MRNTQPLVQVAMALLDEPTGRHWGYELSKKADVRSGVLYPMLTRLLDEGLLADGWEDPTTIQKRRPPRRYYTVTDKGLQKLGAVVQKARSEPRFAHLFTQASRQRGTGFTPATNCGSIWGSFAPGLGWRVVASPAGR
ncbi:MAG TPA: PadR family transcriptional regulator [Pseudonocardiaceae bacterium]